MPNSVSVDTIVSDIKQTDIDIIFHYIMFDRINDSAEDVNKLLSFFDGYDHELRLLRFNACPNIDLKESMLVNDSIDILKKSDLKFKYQISAGSEIAAACGQFICKEVN
jgi:adenine C2-methylase RlmN of 23S rRNA A2503 and tRNA A37